GLLALMNAPQWMYRRYERSQGSRRPYRASGQGRPAAARTALRCLRDMPLATSGAACAPAADQGLRRPWPGRRSPWRRAGCGVGTRCASGLARVYRGRVVINERPAFSLNRALVFGAIDAVVV